MLTPGPLTRICPAAAIDGVVAVAPLVPRAVLRAVPARSPERSADGAAARFGCTGAGPVPGAGLTHVQRLQLRRRHRGDLVELERLDLAGLRC